LYGKFLRWDFLDFFSKKLYQLKEFFGNRGGGQILNAPSGNAPDITYLLKMIISNINKNIDFRHAVLY